MTIDIKDYYLGTPMNRYEYMLIPVKHIPEDIMLQYNLAPLVVNNNVLVEIRKGIYGLPQAGLIAQQRLNTHLSKHGYTPAASTPGLYIHHTRKTTFTLIVDDFGVKYHNKTDALHIINYLKEQYTITTDWTGKLYIGITLRGVLLSVGSLRVVEGQKLFSPWRMPCDLDDSATSRTLPTRF